MRCFTAIDLPEEVNSALVTLQETLPAGKPVAADHLHLTLTFLDDQPDEVLEELHLGLSALRWPSFDLMLAGLGTFGARRPAVLYAAVADQPDLHELQARIASVARRAGVTLEKRRFRPHVTLARFKSRVEGVQLERLRRLLEAQATLRLGPFPVTSFALYGSTLTRAGPVHEELARYYLTPRAGQVLDRGRAG